MIQFLESEDVSDWTLGLYGGCSSGDLGIVKFIGEKGATVWNDGLKGAYQEAIFPLFKR